MRAEGSSGQVCWAWCCASGFRSLVVVVVAAAVATTVLSMM